FDAVVAATFASFVTESALTSAAGGGFMLAYPARDKSARLYDFFTDVPGRGRTGANEEMNFYGLHVNFGGMFQELHIGEGAAAMPGNVAGMATVFENHCTLPLKELLAPAIEYARDGIELSSCQANFNGILAPVLTASEEARAIYAPAGRELTEGERLVNRPMAETFDYLAREGLHKFYEGDIARRMLEGFGTRGLLTAKDISEYRVIERTPLKLNYRGRTVFTNPPPSSGGTLIAFALRLIEGFDLSGMAHNGYEHLRLLEHVMKATSVARRKEFDSRIYDENIASEFLSDAMVARYRAIIDAWEAGGTEGELAPVGTSKGPGSGNTTQISVLDCDGNAATVTTSTGIGCGYMIPGTGIMMNSMCGEDDLNPHGFHVTPAGVRMSSMMSPTIVMGGTEPEVALGSGGSKRIRDAIFQVILNIMDFNLPVEEAVNLSRTHYDDGVFQVETGVAGEALDRIEASGVEVNRWSTKHMYFGGVHTVLLGPGGMDGAGDNRRGGAVHCG
ncbi:MAG: gamma-glutamyltransferase, partial [Proteobacteria bacterium]|nr:gamma-glutamyltransferase [Pseudomonadota bacterium]